MDFLMPTKTSLIFFAALLWFPLSLPAADLETAVAAYEAEDYRTAYRHLKHLALNDYPKAQYLLGLLYYRGKGVDQDMAEGIDWLKQAAGNGSYRAAAELGQIYLAGAGVERNETEAMKWIKRSEELANSNNAEEGCD
jgi:TPR repeat protein